MVNSSESPIDFGETCLNLVNKLDRFPYGNGENDELKTLLNTVFTLKVFIDGKFHDIAYVGHHVYEWMETSEYQTKHGKIQALFEVRRKDKSVILFPGNEGQEDIESKAEGLFEHFKKYAMFGFKTKTEAEWVPVYGNHGPLFRIDRTLLGVLGGTRYGTHMIVYTRVGDKDDARINTILTAKRSKKKSTFPDMLDNAAAGGIKFKEKNKLEGRDPCMLREAEEEAGLTEEDMKACKPFGSMTYIYIDDAHAKKGVKTAEEGEPVEGVVFVNPDCQYLYELRVQNGRELKPVDGEVECFYEHDVDTVLADLAKDEYKPNSGLVVILFMERHGLVKIGNFKDKIKPRVDRELPFACWNGRIAGEIPLYKESN